MSSCPHRAHVVVQTTALSKRATRAVHNLRRLAVHTGLVNRAEWSAPASWDTVCRRNAGRAHYNSVRQTNALLRRIEVETSIVEHVLSGGSLFDRGLQARLAREHNVHRSTISRDVAWIFRTLDRRLNPEPPIVSAVRRRPYRRAPWRQFAGPGRS
jgi:hypothetical protein